MKNYQPDDSEKIANEIYPLTRIVIYNSTTGVKWELDGKWLRLTFPNTSDLAQVANPRSLRALIEIEGHIPFEAVCVGKYMMEKETFFEWRIIDGIY